MSCEKCGTHIHSSRTLCKKCNGVTVKAFEKAPTKTRGGIVDGVYMGGRNRAAKAGIADALDIISGNN